MKATELSISHGSARRLHVRMTSVSMGRMFQRGRYGLNQGKEEGRLRLALFFFTEITMPKGPFVAHRNSLRRSVVQPSGKGELRQFVRCSLSNRISSAACFRRSSTTVSRIASRILLIQLFAVLRGVVFLAFGSGAVPETHTRFPCYGDPEYTFSDVEREIQREVLNRNYLARYELRLAEEERAGELALLERLEGKYRPRPEDLEDSPTPQAAEGSRTAVAPVQGLCFRSQLMGFPASFDRIRNSGYNPIQRLPGT